jgi:hypothetical protein
MLITSPPGGDITLDVASKCAARSSHGTSTTVTTSDRSLAKRKRIGTFWTSPKARAPAAAAAAVLIATAAAEGVRMTSYDTATTT